MSVIKEKDFNYNSTRAAGWTTHFTFPMVLKNKSSNFFHYVEKMDEGKMISR